MTDESAKALAEAMNRLAGAIERVSGSNGLCAGIQVWHHGQPNYSQGLYQYQWGQNCQGGAGGNG